MASEEVLRKTLKNADGKPFAKYKGIQNTFSLESFEITFVEVQNDRSGHTYARVRVPLKVAGFPENAASSIPAHRATCVPIRIPFRFSASSRIAPAAVSAAVIRPLKCPPPR